MPTRKEVSKIKADFVSEREKLIRAHMSDQQIKLYDELVKKYLNSPIDSTNTQTIINQIQKAVELFSQQTNTDILKQYTAAAGSLADLNMAYFATMIEDKKKLNQIKQKTTDTLNKRMGLNADGTLKPKGFVDKMISDPSIQQKIVKEVKRSVNGGADQLTLKNNLRKIIVGSPDSTGIFEQHYNTFTKDILNVINNGNSKIYADSLGLRHAYYSGGLIKTSHPLCLKNNGKIFTTDQIEALKTDPRILKMYGKNIADYNPYELPGGYGCLHSWDYITPELAQGNVRLQNKTAAERNKNFIDRNNL